MMKKRHLELRLLTCGVGIIMCNVHWYLWARKNKVCETAFDAQPTTMAVRSSTGENVSL